MTRDPEENPKKSSVLEMMLRFFFSDKWDLLSNKNILIAGMVIGFFTGGGVAIKLGFSIVTGLLIGTVAGFVIMAVLLLMAHLNSW